MVCFESVASPVRLVQRLGRTGRKRAGRCVLLMTAAERSKYEQTRRQARHVADAVRCGSRLALRPSTAVLPASMTRPRPNDLPCAYWEVPAPPPPPQQPPPPHAKAPPPDKENRALQQPAAPQQPQPPPPPQQQQQR